MEPMDPKDYFPSWDRERSTGFLSFRSSIPANATVRIFCQPQEIIKPHTLQYEGPRETFDLMDLVVGRRTQDLFWHGREPISLDFFRGLGAKEVHESLLSIRNGIEALSIPLAGGPGDWKDDARRFVAQAAVSSVITGMDALKRLTHNLGQVEAVQISMQMALTVRNRTGKERDFECLVYGYALD